MEVRKERQAHETHIVRVLSYNTILSGQLVRAVNCIWCIPQWSSAQKIRTDALVDEHGEAAVDVIALQETGSQVGWNALTTQIKRLYPHQTIYTGSLTTVSTSQFPMTSESFNELTAHAPFYPFGTMISHFPENRFSILNIHPSAESYPWFQRERDLQQIRLQLDSLRNRYPSHAVILAGDHNVNLYNNFEYMAMFRILGLERAVTNPFLKPDAVGPQRHYSFYHGANTVWPTNRTTPVAYSGESTRLDYIWVFPSVDNTVSAVYEEEHILYNVNASDHKPVLGIIKFTVREMKT